MAIISAYAIYNGTTSTYVGDENGLVQINCERVRAFSPRPVWLERFLAPGDGTEILYQPTFDVNDVSPDGGTTFYDDNTLQGFWVEQDQGDVMLDVATAEDFITSCDACCDDQPQTVTRFYTSGIPSFAPPTENTYCITRTDNGSTSAHEQVGLDYLTQFVGSVIHTSWVSGTSQYQLSAFQTPTPVGDDVVTAGACT